MISVAYDGDDVNISGLVFSITFSRFKIPTGVLCLNKAIIRHSDPELYLEHRRVDLSVTFTNTFITHNIWRNQDRDWLLNSGLPMRFRRL